MALSHALVLFFSPTGFGVNGGRFSVFYEHNITSTLHCAGYIEVFCSAST